MTNIDFTVVTYWKFIFIKIMHFPVAGHLASRMQLAITAPFPRNPCWPGREAATICLQVNFHLCN
jgi:hypothetical protein